MCLYAASLMIIGTEPRGNLKGNDVKKMLLAATYEGDAEAKRLERSRKLVNTSLATPARFLPPLLHRSILVFPAFYFRMETQNQGDVFDENDDDDG